MVINFKKLVELARRPHGGDRKQLSLFSEEEMRDQLRHYGFLHDGLSDMIEGGRLREEDIPEDYQWLVRMLTTVPEGPE